MKKRFMLFIMLIVIKTFLYSHDTIVLRDGSVINGIVTEITPEEVRYRRADNTLGLVYRVASERVLSVRLADGTVEEIPQFVKPPKPERPREQQPRSPIIDSKRNFYFSIYRSSPLFGKYDDRSSQYLSFNTSWR